MTQKLSKTLVMKFGGTSVGSAEAMAQAVQIVKDAHAEWERVVVVTSAISGATNALLDSAARAVNGDLQAVLANEQWLISNHEKLADALISDPARREQVKQEIAQLVGSFGALCRAIGVLGEASPRAMDAVASLGERLSVRLLAAACESQGVPAKFVESTKLVVTNANFQNAHPDFGATTFATRSILNPLLEAGVVPIVTGFIGATPEGGVRETDS